jgi:hypothetical protein
MLAEVDEVDEALRRVIEIQATISDRFNRARTSEERRSKVHKALARAASKAHELELLLADIERMTKEKP